MLEPRGLNQFINAPTRQKALKQLVLLEKRLKKRFAGQDIEHAIEGLILAVATGEHMLLVGPPGTAKSRLIRAFCHEVGLIPHDEMNGNSGRQTASAAPSERAYFEYLLTQFTEPSELFGYFDLAKLNRNEGLERLSAGMMQGATVVFLDEIFNASSAILNSLLTFMMERRFHDRGEVHPVKLQCLFGATNHIPRTAELRAIFDRFLLRSWVDNVPAESVETLDELFSRGIKETVEPPRPIPELSSLIDIAKMLQYQLNYMLASNDLAYQPNKNMTRLLGDIIRHCRQRGLSDMSNRRLVKFIRVMAFGRLLRAIRETSGSDLDVLLRDIREDRGNDRQWHNLKIEGKELELLALFGLDVQPGEGGISNDIRQMISDAEMHPTSSA